jgi:xylulokinase
MLLRGGLYTVAWFVERFASDLRAGPGPRPEEVLESQAATLPPGAGGLVAVPYWNGVMNPYWDAAATGITVGWTGAHTRAHFYRAILEGIAFEQRLAGDAVMAVLGQPFDEYIALGGGSRSSLWCQIIADVTGVPVARSSAVEATCLGAGILAAAAIGWYPSVAAAANSMTSTAQRFTPDPAARATYDQLYDEVYRRLFPTLRSLLDRLASLSATGEAAPNKASSAMP